MYLVGGGLLTPCIYIIYLGNYEIMKRIVETGK